MKRVGKRGWVILGVAAVVIVVVVVVLVVSCGGSSSSTQTPEEWANGLCTSANTYVSSLKSLGTELQSGGVTQANISSAVDGAKTSTETFSSDIKALGSPPVSDSEAKSILESLSGELSDDAAAVQNAISNVSTVSDVVGAVSAISATITSAGTQIGDAYSQLKQLDPKGEVQQAFADAPACKSLIGSS